MADNGQPDRTKVTFSQAEGLEALPVPLALGELSTEVRSLLWQLIYDDLTKSARSDAYGRYLSGRWEAILLEKHVAVDFLLADEFQTRLSENIELVKIIITKHQWNLVFDFLHS